MSDQKVFKLEESSEQYKFLMCREEIAGYTGGYGNGKTATLGVLGINIASLYQGARILVGRATRPKLEDSTKPELLKWLPKDWVASWPSERKNNIVMKGTGSTIEFRHVRMEGKGKGEEQSNLLSATYDAIFIDQLDDPEFSYKDFEDLFGRLRGTAKFIGTREEQEEGNWPSIGPQFFRFGANPTRNWLFRDVVNPYFVYMKTGLITDKLLRDPDTNKPIIEIFNAPSSANKANTGERFSKRMQIVMRSTSKKRFVDGDWSAYEGLIYPEFDESKHVIHHEALENYIREQLHLNKLGVGEGYDYGQTSPSCYLLSFHDAFGNVFIVDGYYKSQFLIAQQGNEIRRIRNHWGIVPTDRIYADPSIFKLGNATKDKVGEKISQLFHEEGVEMQRGSNDIASGIEKISSYLAIDSYHMHPIQRVYGSPRLFISSNLEWWHNEALDYYWNKNTLGQNVDKPRDVNDHAMDATKYLFTKRNKVIGSITQLSRKVPDTVLYGWNPAPDTSTNTLLPRHR